MGLRHPHPGVIYTLGRLGCAFLTGAILYSLGLRSFLLLITALLLSAPISFFLLRAPRQAFAERVEQKMTASRERRERIQAVMREGEPATPTNSADTPA
jgi:hypothetical protein